MNIPYHLSRIQGVVRRRIYHATLARRVSKPFEGNQRVKASVYTLSCERDLPEQVAAIYSFLTHVGIPDAFNVVSDGTYTSESRQTLRSIHPCVNVRELGEFISHDFPDHLTAFVKNTLWGKKLAVELSMPVDNCAIWMDCDILFFRGGEQITRICHEPDANCYYLPDNVAWLDPDLLEGDDSRLPPVNAGFFILKRQLDWSLALDRLRKLGGKYHTYTEQTLVHLTMHNEDAQRLDPSIFVLQTDDRFIYTDLYSKKPIALRHYVTPVRHKFWNALTQANG
jgi:hypothetical protein